MTFGLGLVLVFKCARVALMQERRALGLNTLVSYGKLCGSVERTRCVHLEV